MFLANTAAGPSSFIAFNCLWRAHLGVARAPRGKDPFLVDPILIWVWVKIKPPGDHKFSLFFPSSRVPFWVPTFDPQPFPVLEI